MTTSQESRNGSSRKEAKESRSFFDVALIVNWIGLRSSPRFKRVAKPIGQDLSIGGWQVPWVGRLCHCSGVRPPEIQPHVDDGAPTMAHIALKPRFPSLTGEEADPDVAFFKDTEPLDFQ